MTIVNIQIVEYGIRDINDMSTVQENLNTRFEEKGKEKGKWDGCQCLEQR